MANLIIKSSADNLVLQGSDASPAITVGTDGTTTFAEAATMSGNVTMSGTANNLGTTTAGTLSSGVTFPSGHVLKVVYAQDVTTQALASSTYTDTGLSASLTPSSATNKVLVTWTMQADLATADRGFGVKLLRDDGGGYDSLYESATKFDLYAAGSSGGRVGGSWAFLDTPAVTVATTYKIQVGNYNANAMTYNNVNQMTYITLMEVVA